MIQLRALGTVTLLGGDGRVLQSVLTQPKRLALLLYLAAAAPRTCHRRDRLLALFWPELDEERSRAALRQAVYHLRRSLGEGAILSRGDSELGVDPERVRCDVVEFERDLDGGNAEQALARYGGALAEGLHVGDAPEFERWLGEERLRLKRRAAAAAWQLAEAAEERGDAAGAVELARRATALDPENEAGARWLIACLDRKGDRAGAIRAYEQLAARLRDELDAEPSAETQALVQAVRERASPRAAPPALVSAAAPPVAGQAPAAQPPVSVLARGRGIHRGRRMVAGLLLVVCVGAGAVRVLRPDPDSGLYPNRVLVAAFENRTGDPSLDPLGNLAADRIIQGLSQTDLVEVVDPSTALLSFRSIRADTAWADEPARVRALARATGAGTIVWGSYYRTEDSVRLQAHVTDAAAGALLRTAPAMSGFVGSPASIAETARERVIGVLATIFDERLAALSVPSSPPPTLGAYREYVRGMELFGGYRYDEAALSFSSSARLDSTFALPLVWAAFALGNNGRWADRDSVISVLESRRERLAPLDRHALDFFSAAAREDLPGTLEAVRQAARLAPRSNWTYMLGRQAKALNRPREAVRALTSIDPEVGWARGWDEYWDVLCASYHLLGEHEEELKAARRGRALNPQSFRTRAFELQALAALGRVEEIGHAIDDALSLPSTGRTPGDLMRHAAVELRAHGHADAARGLVARAIEWHRSIPPDSGGGVAHQAGLAQALYLAGDWDAAERLFASLAEERPNDVNFRGYLGVLAARRGDAGAADRADRTLREIGVARQGATATYWRARIAAVSGQRALALSLLQQAYAQGLNHGAYFPARSGSLHSDLDLEPLRNTREFRALLRNKG